jgi:uncharacterized protein (DUF4415 family)
MKQRKRVTRPRRAQQKISRLRASAEGDGGPPTRLQQRRRSYKALKKQITLYLDADVLEWFKRAGRGYQTRINRALWEVMREERKMSGE